MSHATRFLAGVALGFITGLLGLWLSTDDSNADHLRGLNTTPVLIAQLHPGSGGSAFYTLCTNDPATEAVWSYGPEVWSKYMMRVNLVQGPECSSSTSMRTVMMWEYVGFLTCSSGDAACWRAIPRDYYTHDGHDHLEKSYVLF